MALSETIKARIIKDHCDGMSQRQLAKKYKVTQTTVGRVLKKKSDVVQMVAQKKAKTIEEWLIQSQELRTDIINEATERIKAMLPNADMKTLVGIYKIFVETDMETKGITDVSGDVQIVIKSSNARLTEEEAREKYGIDDNNN